MPNEVKDVSNDSKLLNDTVSAQPVPHHACLNITVESGDLDKLSSRVAVFGYVAGLCARFVSKVLKCTEMLVVESGDTDSDTDMYFLTAHLNLSGLNFPSDVWLLL